MDRCHKCKDFSSSIFCFVRSVLWQSKKYILSVKSIHWELFVYSVSTWCRAWFGFVWYDRMVCLLYFIDVLFSFFLNRINILGWPNSQKKMKQLCHVVLSAFLQSHWAVCGSLCKLFEYASVCFLFIVANWKSVLLCTHDPNVVYDTRILLSKTMSDNLHNVSLFCRSIFLAQQT